MPRTPHPETPHLLEDWLDNQAVMHLLHISPRTLLTLRNNGTLPFSRIGNKIYYKRSDINKILQNNYKCHPEQNTCHPERSEGPNTLSK
jgi:hypothetical protein